MPQRRAILARSRLLLRSGDADRPEQEVADSMFSRPATAYACFASLVSIALVACAGTQPHMKAHYTKSEVQPVKIDKFADDQIRVHYNMPAETLYYSPGLNYQSVDGTLRLFIDRCHIRETCKVMAEAPMSPDTGWRVAAQVPYHGEKVVLVYTDAEEQVYP
jgi:hypothetical protein